MRIAQHVRKLAAYVPGEQPKAKNVIKLNTNENPYPPSPACGKVLSSFALENLRKYPDPQCMELRAEIAKLHGTKIENVLIGNGSDEILAMATRAFMENDELVASLDPSYSLYKTVAEIRGSEWVASGDGYLGGAESVGLDKRAAVFMWANPNAPTGNWVDPGEIAAFAHRFKGGVVLVDEAYADFAKENCMKIATSSSNRNIVVVRTLSKSYSLAGLRVGYCVGPTDLIAAMNKVRDSYNVDAIAQAVALAALKDRAWMQANVKKILATRQKFVEELIVRDWDVPDTEANFVFARPPRPHRASQIYTRLKERGIYVRFFKGVKTSERLRITIGTDSQMAKLLKALDELVI
jgi:histidinol-phosphate aminotransferase